MPGHRNDTKLPNNKNWADTWFIYLKMWRLGGLAIIATPGVKTKLIAMVHVGDRSLFRAGLFHGLFFKVYSPEWRHDQLIP